MRFSFVSTFGGAVFALAGFAAAAYETTASHAFLVDHETGAVLYEKNADELMPPSSMSKLMTAYVVFKALKEEKLRLTDQLPVSQKAWRLQGSKMFVMVGTRVGVEDLLRGMIIQSGNDACVVLAEGLSGSEERFADEMNRVARQIGLSKSVFRNSTGWPEPEHLMTARELATVARRIVDDFPEYYHFYSELDFTYGKDAKGKDIKQGNRNPLLYKNIGVDGLKTGHTDAAGYGLTFSGTREGRRVVGVLNGLKSMNVRSQEAERLFDYGFAEFTNAKLFAKGEKVDDAQVWLGEKADVSLVMEQPLTVTMTRKARREMKVRLVYDGPIAAPVRAGQVVGKVEVSAPGFETVERRVVAGADVERLGMPQRLFAAFNHLLYGSSAGATAQQAPKGTRLNRGS